jgi:hypothetical protein
MTDEDVSDRAPFRKWSVDSMAAPQSFDALRLNQIPPDRREFAWLQRRRHSPCGLLIPPEWAMDSIHYRYDGEQQYVRALWRLGNESPEVPLDGLGLHFMCRSRPFIPFAWPAVRANGPKAAKSASCRGQLILPGDPHPRDSAYALIRASMLAGHGNPTRFVDAHWWEARHRRKGVLLSWTQVEYYEQSSVPKDTLYPKIPAWFADYDVPAAMYVPHPGVVAYRGKALLNNDSLHWAVFRTEWTVNVFARWVDDAHYRGLLWHLPIGVRRGIDRLTVVALLQGGEYAVATVDGLLRLHDGYSWISDLSHITVLSQAVPLARRGDSFEILGPFEVRQDSSAVGVYSDDMTIPDSPEYDYSARDPVLARLQVPRVPVTVEAANMTGGELPRGSVGSGPVETRGGAAAPTGKGPEWRREPQRGLTDAGATGLRPPVETVRLVPVGDPWEEARPIRRYEPDPYAPDPYSVPTLRVSLLQSRLRELDLWAAVVGKYGDGHILDEETIMATILGLTAERNQARERAELAEEAVREVAKREREGKDDLEMEVRRIRMAMEQVTNAAERLDDMVSRKRRRKE